MFTWDDIRKSVQTHFSPQDETWDARMNINFIKKTGSLQAYPWDFSGVMLELLDKSKKDKVLDFIIGFKL